MVRASRRVRELRPYAFAEVGREVDRLRASGVEPTDFGVGDPTTPTPTLVREAMKRAADARAASGYPSYEGSPELREAACAWLERRFGVKLDPATQVCSTIGSKEAVFHLPFAVLDPGEVAVCPTPGYPPYVRGTRFAGGEPFFLPITRSNGFLMELDRIPREVLARTRVIWLCYPNSPSGRVAPRAWLEEAVAFGRKHGILVCSDEAYSEIYFGGEAPCSALEQGSEGVLAFFSLSKRSAMTCYRVGFVAGDAEAVAAFKKVKTNIDSGTATFVQDAAVAALADEEHVRAMREEYRAKRDILVAGLRAAGLPDCTPEATLYIWQRGPEGMPATDLAKRFLAPDVACVTTPGTWISDPLPDGTNPGEGHVRFALVPSIEDTRRAAESIARMKL